MITDFQNKMSNKYWRNIRYWSWFGIPFTPVHVIIIRENETIIVWPSIKPVNVIRVRLVSCDQWTNCTINVAHILVGVIFGIRRLLCASDFPGGTGILGVYTTTFVLTLCGALKSLQFHVTITRNKKPDKMIKRRAKISVRILYREQQYQEPKDYGEND